MQKQKKEISVQCQNGINFIEELYYKMTHFKEYMNRFSKDLDKKKLKYPLGFILCLYL
jgi:hypothetical protein